MVPHAIIAGGLRLDMLRRHNRLLIARVFMALALVIAQSSAQAHLYSHRPADQPATPTQLCGECLCFAPVLGTASAPQHDFLIPRAALDPIDTEIAFRSPALRSFRAFNPRAPPAPR
jgi:hypothetical protein